jgi:hypothetical protein
MGYISYEKPQIAPKTMQFQIVDQDDALSLFLHNIVRASNFHSGQVTFYGYLP